MKYRITAEQPSRKPGEKIILRVEFPTFTEAWMSMSRFIQEGWRITEAPEAVEFPTSFPVDLGSAA